MCNNEGQARIASLAVLLAAPPSGAAQEASLSQLERELLEETPEALGRQARQQGDAQRGALLFFQQQLACAKCHVAPGDQSPLGPDLSRPVEPRPDAAHLVSAVLTPSKDLRQGYQPLVVQLNNGRRVRGLVVREDEHVLELRSLAQQDAAAGAKAATVQIPRETIEARKQDATSLMPERLASQIGSRQQFLDLIKYLIEVNEHGPARAAELQPPLALLGPLPLPEYESRVDHAGLISSLDAAALRRGEEIYARLCVNCHGTHERPGSLPTSLRFASGTFKRGSDPYSMYLTLTHGFGQMMPQTWMVPQQKYDVIHYIRERYLKPHNSSQYSDVNDTYLASLPAGDTRGPKPVKYEPWVTMDYGPTLTHTYEVGRDASNFAYKGVAVRLDEGPGGVSRGRQWMVFDHDTLRWAAGWSGQGFIDWNGIMFNGRHAIHPRVAGRVGLANPAGPGWGRPGDGSFDDPRLQGRDDRPYGPLPRDWAKFKGLYHYGSQAVVSYTVGDTPVLEMPQGGRAADADVFVRTLNLGARPRDLLMQVARAPKEARRAVLRAEQSAEHTVSVISLTPQAADTSSGADSSAWRFDGKTFVELDDAAPFDWTGKDYSIHARLRTRRGGTILAMTAPGPEWVPDGKALFVRGGRLVFDIGWVGAVQSNTKVDDNRWHDVLVTWQRDGQVRLYVDGELDGQGRLRPKAPVEEHVVRIGFAAPDFPRAQSHFAGELSEVSFYQRSLSQEEAGRLVGSNARAVQGLAARWSLRGSSQQVAAQDGEHAGRVIRGDGGPPDSTATWGLVASATGPEHWPSVDAHWQLSEAGDLRLKIPAGEDPLQLTVRVAAARDAKHATKLAQSLLRPLAPIDLEPLTRGGPPRWPTALPTMAVLGDDSGPFALDVLSHPQANPWLCRVRPTGLDFFAGGDAAAVCTWDGDVWRVSGLLRPEQGLSWRRIASGMFQPLGLKIVDGQIFVTCRDQLTILRDLNGDGETDFYECFNNDHQVTEHFHEFAMGLQRDEAGNFYYAKSARHALPALVPHHGTLLRVAADGSRTDIVATGFRAANGVCLNPDGTFIVTDQEGHWNPKNRINWVTEGGFYGNMFGYHDVTDSSDSAMQQPLCWITNDFDRSPAELLWVTSSQWGPLQGSLLNLSYGYGRVFIVPHERVDGQVQGGMCQLPLPDTPTGLIRGRFHPGDGQLYVCGMFAWAGSRQQPGGLYRIRYTQQPVHLPVGLEATRRGMRLTFSGPLDRGAAAEASRYDVKIWSLKRTANYGSPHIDERPLAVKSAAVSDDGRVVQLHLPEMQTTWCMEIRYRLRSAAGQVVEGVVHNTVHRLGED